ncbi:MAG: glycosyltransferase [Candidatus Dormibacteraeota bacterium]|nr:glycosyltransferase [Candidatus Dormibacteraeota bacterium]
MTEPLLSVVLPAYREGPRIYANLERLLAVLQQLPDPFEVVVVSDGNTDATASEARRLKSEQITVLEYAANMGKGFALAHGVQHARGSLIAFIDADMELSPAAIPIFIGLMRRQDCDVVVGSKRHRLSIVQYPMYRRFQSWIYQVLIRVLFDLDIRDTQTGVKLFRRQVLVDSLPRLAVKRFAFDLELLVVAHHLGYRKIIEGPIHLDYRFESTVRLSSAWQVLWDTAAIFYRLRILRYYDRAIPLAPASLDAPPSEPEPQTAPAPTARAEP